jgi:plastocyanin
MLAAVSIVSCSAPTAEGGPWPTQTYGEITVTLVRPGTTPYVAPTPAVGTAVAVLGLAYDPPTLEVPLGATVIWTNKDAIAHTITSGVPGIPDGRFDGQVFGGSAFSFAFPLAGTYAYYCRLHTSMAARLVVR